MSRQKDKIIVIGGKGTAVNIAEQIDHADRESGAPVEFLGFAIDDDSLGKEINGYPVLCKTREAKDKYPQQDVKFLFTLYKPEKMKERVALLKSYEIPSYRFATFVHPMSYISKSAQLGTGVVVLSNSTVQNNASIGDYTIVNSNVVVEHDTAIGESNFFSPASCIGAYTQTGTGVFVGYNSATRPGIEIGEYAFIGMGSNVIGHVPSNAIVYGNPTRNHSDTDKQHNQ